jgi:hypothetical protein
LGDVQRFLWYELPRKWMTDPGQERSGIAPPDLPELTWGPVMGVQEASAHTAVAATLGTGRRHLTSKGTSPAQP